MQEFFALETMILALAAPCMISWIAGEVHGARRMQKLMEAGQRISQSEHELAIMPHSISKAESAGRQQWVCEATTQSADTRDIVIEGDTLDDELAREDALWRKRELEAMWAEREAQVEAEEAEQKLPGERTDLEAALDAFARSTRGSKPDIRAFRDALEEEYLPPRAQKSEKATMPLVRAG